MCALPGADGLNMERLDPEPLAGESTDHPGG